MKVASPFWKTVATGVIALSILAAMPGAAAPQLATPQPAQSVQEPPQPAPEPQPSPSPENPGLLNEMGKLFNKIIPPLKSPGEAIDDLNARAKDTVKDAGDALSRLTPGA